MTKYSQRDIRWRFKKLGFCNGITIGGYGCAITCLAMLCGKRPDKVNEILKRGGGFVNGCLVWWQKACNLLGLGWYGMKKTPSFFPCIVRVRMSNGFDHFVIALNNYDIIDPLDGKKKSNNYVVVEYVMVKQPKVKTPAKPVENTNKYPKRIKVVVPALYVRKAPNRRARLSGSKILRRGDVFTAVGAVRGERVEGNDLWYVSIYGNYVWSGGCKVI